MRDGVAMSLALDTPAVASGMNYSISGGVATYDGAEAFGMAGSFRVSENLIFSTGLGYGFDTKEVGARAGFQLSW